MVEFSKIKKNNGITHNISKYKNTDSKLGFIIYLKIEKYVHWISVWVDVENRIIRYFDSNADQQDRYYVLDMIKLMREKLFDDNDVLLEYNNKYK